MEIGAKVAEGGVLKTDGGTFGGVAGDGALGTEGIVGDSGAGVTGIGVLTGCGWGGVTAGATALSCCAIKFSICWPTACCSSAALCASTSLTVLAQYKELKPVGRLDKDSSGLLLLTNDGELAHQLTHPSFQKLKIYEVELDQSVASADLEHLKRGVWLDDGLSRLSIQKLVTSKQQRAGQEILVPDSSLLVAMTEGRNRQIRRTFEALGYTVVELKRMQFGDYALGTISEGEFRVSS